jgi:hypothetical protein
MTHPAILALFVVTFIASVWALATCLPHHTQEHSNG